MKDIEKENGLELVKFYRENPVIAAQDLLNIDLAPHQRLSLEAMWFKNYTILCLSRGCGKTFMLAVFAVLRAMLFPGEKIGIIAPTYRQAKFVFAEVEKLYERSPEFRAVCLKPPIKAPELCYVTLMSHNNRPGSEIHALPLGDGSKIRGARFFTIVCDELAQVPKEILDVVIRGMMATSKDPMENVRRMEEQTKLLAEGKIDKIEKPTQNKLVFASTAYYQYNHFWQTVCNFHDLLVTKMRKAKALKDKGEPVPPELQVTCRGNSPNGGQVLHRVMYDDERAVCMFNYLDPPAGFMNMESIDEARREMSDYMFRMEYEAYFPPDSAGFIPRSLLDKARTHRQFSCALKSGNPREVYVMGIDPARSGDNLAIAIFRVEPDNNEIHLVRMITYHNTPFPEIHSEIRKLIKLYNIAEIGIDAGGGGTTIRDLLATKELCPPGEPLILQRDYEDHQFMQGRKIVELIQFSRYDWVHDSNHGLLSGLQHGRIKIASRCSNITNPKITPEREAADDEIDATLEEVQNIIVTATKASGRMHWDTPLKHQRKDRYSAVLIGAYMGLSYIDSCGKPIELCGGFWG